MEPKWWTDIRELAGAEAVAAVEGICKELEQTRARVAELEAHIGAVPLQSDVCHITKDGVPLCGATPDVLVHGGRLTATCLRCLQLDGRCDLCGVYHETRCPRVLRVK